MYTSDTKKSTSQLDKMCFAYLLISLFCVLFGTVYEHFSHEVYSNYMIYAFVFPLAGGVLPFMAMSRFHVKRLPGRLSLNLYHSGIATLTVGSIMRGVLDIYGTTNDLLQIYWFAGISFVLVGFVMYALSAIRSKNTM